MAAALWRLAADSRLDWRIMIRAAQALHSVAIFALLGCQPSLKICIGWV